MLKGIRQETVVKSGGVIELTSTDLPVGTSVEVIILVNDGANKTSEASSNDEKWARFYEKVVGAWKDDEDIHQVFAEIEQARHLDRGRETPVFDD
jgi:hypothetical protein